MRGTTRISFEPVEHADKILTSEFLEYLVHLYDRFAPRVHRIRARRAEMIERAVKHGVMPGPPPTSEANTGAWKVPQVPEDLKRPGIEISGPASITPMFINALNPGPDGTRAEGYLDDDEDSAGHRLADTVSAARNRLGAVERSLGYVDPVTRKEYSIKDGVLPFFMHRDRGMHLDEPDLTVDEKPVPAAILGTALTLFHAGRAQIERGQGVYFYLPKMELVEEATLYRDILDESSPFLGLPSTAVIRAIPLIESLPAAYQMEEMLYALGPYAAGLNAARWDFKASIFEYYLNDPNSVWPDRFGVDIKTTDFLANVFRRLVAICLKRGAVPIGGMATALPDRDPEVNESAGSSIRADKVWEANQGFVRGWVAHIFHMKTAGDPFKEVHGPSWVPTAEVADPDRYPIEISVPKGPITVAGTRRNARMLIEYIEGWLAGRGAKGIDSLAGQPGLHGFLMEDLATGRMSVAQVAQRIIHSAQDTSTGQTHDFALVKSIIREELADILRLREDALGHEDGTAAERYENASKIAVHWIKNYTEFNYRSLGSYTRAELEEIAALEDESVGSPLGAARHASAGSSG